MEAPGDRNPSEFLRHLQSLAENTANDSILKSLWISQLPHQTKAILASQPNAELRQPAISADAINDTAPNYASVSEINEFARGRELSAQVEELSRKFDEAMRSLESNRQRAYPPHAPGRASIYTRTTARSPSRHVDGKKFASPEGAKLVVGRRNHIKDGDPHRNAT